MVTNLRVRVRCGLMLLVLVISGCSEVERSPLERAFMSAHPAMLNVLHDPVKYEVQILFTQVDTDESGEIVLTEHQFRVNDSAYFYPASTIKLPLAIMASEMIDSYQDISLETTYTLEGDTTEHTINDDLRQLFAVSDNEAFNRLYEMVGRDYFNDQGIIKKLGPLRLAHRLSTDSADLSKRRTLYFTSRSDTLMKLGGGRDSVIVKLDMPGVIKGKGYVRNEEIVNNPMDFSQKNYFPLRTQHEIIKRLVYPELFNESERFDLGESTRALLLEHMSKTPRQQGYDPASYQDSYVKFFLFGDSKNEIPETLHIYNKVGFAYGTVTETAFIEDVDNDIRFFLSATILVNKNRIFNDDNYEYESIGIPFMAQLGRELYMYERARK